MDMTTPQSLIEMHGRCQPEQHATELGFAVTRMATAPNIVGVRVLSEYAPELGIVLYTTEIRRQAKERSEPIDRLEQWHIAHELYHALAEQHGASPWRVRETEADVWADELMALCS